MVHNGKIYPFVWHNFLILEHNNPTLRPERGLNRSGQVHPFLSFSSLAELGFRVIFKTSMATLQFQLSE